MSSINLFMTLRILAFIAGIVALCQALPLGYALFNREDYLPMLQSMLSGLAICGVGVAFTRHADTTLRPRDGFLITTLAWFAATFVAALPYIYGGLLGWVDAIFEVASGFTTTGSSILSNIEIWPRNQLLWRSATQWIGGMGILLLAIAIIPLLGVGGMQLMKAEVPGPNKERLVPRLTETAKILWGLYVGITILCILAYLGSGMGIYDAVNHAFTTLATGGYSTRNASMGAFSPAAQWWSALFMTMAGANFTLYYRLVLQRDGSALNDPELKLYLFFIGACGLFGALVLLAIEPGKSIELALRESFFQVVSIMTTTGYASADWEQWPAVSQLMLALLMLVGGMAGSTGGGMKVVRFAIVLKQIPAAFHRLLKPNQIIVSRLGSDPLDRDVVEACVSFLVITMFLLLWSGLFLHALGMDLLSAMSAALTALNNVGPGLGSVGAVDNFSQVPQSGKLLLSLLMIIGRLEIFTVIILLFPRFWRQ